MVWQQPGLAWEWSGNGLGMVWEWSGNGLATAWNGLVIVAYNYMSQLVTAAICRSNLHRVSDLSFSLRLLSIISLPGRCELSFDCGSHHLLVLPIQRKRTIQFEDPLLMLMRTPC